MRTFLGVAIASFLLGFPIRATLVRFGVIDRPNARSSHDTPTARGGGLGFVAILAVALALFGRTDAYFAAVCAATVALAGLSFVDDIRSIGVGPRLACQALAASVAAAGYASVDGATASTFALAGVAFVGCLGYTNAFNFMDGINGIAASHAVITGLAGHGLAVHAGAPREVALLPLVVAGGALGFLPWNLPRARMFMGDVGSATLGYLSALVVVLVVRAGGLRFVVPFALIHAGFFLDTAITFLRRLARGDRVSEAHREHFYQRLVRSGSSHLAVTTLYTTLTLSGSAIAFATRRSGTSAIALYGTLVIAAWLALFAFAERRFRAHEEGGRT